MLYSKLPIVFLSTIASEKNNSTNCIIASYILDHLEEVRGIGIKELASKCNVAISSISRFCKEIGLRDFMELKELLNSTNLYFEENSLSNNPIQRTKDYAEKIRESIDMVRNSLSINQLLMLCDDIDRYQTIAVFGLLKAGSVAINLQGDLLMLGKKVYTNISYAQQIEYIMSANKDDLIIIFSYTGSYFDYQSERELRNKLKEPKIWLICSRKEEYPSFIDQTITFDSNLDQISHPYQLQFIASLLAQEYAQKYKK